MKHNILRTFTSLRGLLPVAILALSMLFTACGSVKSKSAKDKNYKQMYEQAVRDNKLLQDSLAAYKVAESNLQYTGDIQGAPAQDESAGRLALRFAPTIIGLIAFIIAAFYVMRMRKRLRGHEG